MWRYILFENIDQRMVNDESACVGVRMYCIAYMYAGYIAIYLQFLLLVKKGLFLLLHF